MSRNSHAHAALHGILTVLGAPSNERLHPADVRGMRDEAKFKVSSYTISTATPGPRSDDVWTSAPVDTTTKLRNLGLRADPMTLTSIMNHGELVSKELRIINSRLGTAVDTSDFSAALILRNARNMLRRLRDGVKKCEGACLRRTPVSCINCVPVRGIV